MDADCSLSANTCQAGMLAHNFLTVWNTHAMEQYPHVVFGNRLQRLIDESPYKGESQRRLGRRFDVSGPTVNEWLKGKKMPGIETAIRVALVLDVCVEYLLTGRGPKDPNAHTPENGDDNGGNGDDGNGTHLDISDLPHGQQVHLRALVHAIQEQITGYAKKISGTD